MDEPPTPGLSEQLAELETMSALQLRDRYAEVFEESSRSNNRRWLHRRIAWRLQAQAEGGLSERAQTRARELARDEDIRLRPPKDRGPQLGAQLKTVTGTLVRRDDRLPIPGTVLSRTYRREEYLVSVLPHGFEYEDKIYRSLSAVAHAITGTHWNGYQFFGLSASPRKTKRKEPA